MKHINFILSLLYKAQNTKHEIRDTISLLLHEAQGTYKGRGTKYEAQGTRHKVRSSKYKAPGTKLKHKVQGTRYEKTKRQGRQGRTDKKQGDKEDKNNLDKSEKYGGQ